LLPNRLDQTLIHPAISRRHLEGGPSGNRVNGVFKRAKDLNIRGPDRDKYRDPQRDRDDRDRGPERALQEMMEPDARQRS
jgi:hypothetical protein